MSRIRDGRGDQMMCIYLFCFARKAQRRKGCLVLPRISRMGRIITDFFSLVEFGCLGFSDLRSAVKVVRF